ncbi:MAG: flagellar protein FliS [Micrococcus sp.]|nr:flagellar protein FliS [Micrococcus sp.]
MLASANRTAIAQMRRQELLTATPAQLTVKLFQRLMLDLNRAAVDLETGNTGSASANLVHAQAILAELDATLDVTGWAGAEDLKAVYGYCLQTIDAANRNSDPVGVATAIELMAPVAEAFEQAAKTA